MTTKWDGELKMSPWIGFCCLLPAAITLIFVEIPPDNIISLVLVLSSIIIFAVAMGLAFIVDSSRNGKIVGKIRDKYPVILVLSIIISTILIFISGFV